MATIAKLTLSEFLAQPDVKPGREYSDGQVAQKQMPNAAHMMVQALLGITLGLFIHRNRLGIFGPECRCIFGPAGGERALLPDFLFLAAAHVKDLDLNGPIHRAPDLAVEVLSPDDRSGDVSDKLSFYVTHGVRLVWLINPMARTVTVMTTPREARILTEDDTLDGGDVLPGFSCAVRDILPPADASVDEATG